MFIQTKHYLKNYISKKAKDYDAIVVEGYDGVGKGRVLSLLSEVLGEAPYRPDYNLWQQYDHRNIDRWKVSGFFWDVFSHFYKDSGLGVMLFDRGVISGAVYNGDRNIARDYKKLLRGMRVLHILVTCSEKDYKRFSEIRGSDSADYSDYLAYTSEYMECFEIAGVDYLIYLNQYSESESERLSDTCEGCGHYNHGYCRHPKMDIYVDSRQKRCQYSTDKEVQDIDSEMQCV